MFSVAFNEFRKATQNRRGQRPDVFLPTSKSNVLDPAAPSSIRRKFERQSTVVAGTGEQLAIHCSHLFRETVELGLSCVSWPDAEHRSQIVQVYEQFFRDAKGWPAVLWGHPLCWTDTLMTSLNQLEVRRVSTAYRPFPAASKAHLQFESGRRLDIDTGSIEWSPPEGENSEILRMAKVVQRRRTIAADGNYWHSYRETLGAVVDVSSDEPWLRHAFYPCMRRVLYGVNKDESVGWLVLRPRDLAIGESENQRSDGKSAQEFAGILETTLLKATRMYLRDYGETERQPTIEELCATFDDRGRVISLVASHERLESAYSTARYEDNFLIQWLDRYRS
ncbi:MAG: hypothetical protein U0746_03010 [Gemmataceae bacterium]